jgi:mono/diheme cytochrome c family protein
MSAMNLKINNKPITEFDPEMYHTKLQASDHGFSILPPDFTWDSIRSAASVEELYIRISAGVGGTTMPSWKGTLSDDDIWAVAHYVKSLIDLKDTPERQKLLEKIKN